MESEIIKRISEEQKEAVLSIPSFLNNHQETPIDVNEVEKAILNNVPGTDNTTVEEINHLNELERACQNWTKDEWDRVITHANSRSMLRELARRMGGFEDYVKNQRANMGVLTEMKL